MVPTGSECLRSSLLQLRNERAAHPDLGLLKLRGLIWKPPKHRSAKILVELQALRGVYGTMFCCSASGRMLCTGMPRAWRSDGGKIQKQSLGSAAEQLQKIDGREYGLVK